MVLIAGTCGTDGTCGTAGTYGIAGTCGTAGTYGSYSWYSWYMWYSRLHGYLQCRWHIMVATVVSLRGSYSWVNSYVGT